MNASATYPTEMVEHALAWARRGFAVFPCNPSPTGEDSKRPLVPRDKDEQGKPIPKTGGFYKATRDEEQIRRLWRRWPKAMIGLRMGHDAGTFALDPDVVKKPGDADGLAVWRRLAAEHGDVPATHTHVTPSGGRHLLFRYPEDRSITNAEGDLPKGINVRGEGGYVAARSGRRRQGPEGGGPGAGSEAGGPRRQAAARERR
ncbi:bifunctional DNA primase/polymerase [Methylobacterium nodulans]|uniref:Bifunctional DNA primase/polymerase n=1 Tax=Methylobacterium nodulans (strain LMG 21967 / CNCM I-2342 / ORS 2060) TaxID=460265 RepID=B8IT85_METNO|nr:bifunctional DNA primase/polymerase [Methylobacterium nodulans]ACL56971.1 Bifunctional DNA primase/polymerase [Methylobacterium nodulans ORS 2060]